MILSLKRTIGYLLVGAVISVTGWWYWLGPKVALNLRERADNGQGKISVLDHSVVTEFQFGYPNPKIPSMPFVDYSVVTKKRRKNFENAQSIGAVSLLTILGNPNSFHGKRVIVMGYAIIELEHHAIYPSRDMVVSAKNGVWIECDNDVCLEYLKGKGMVPVFLEAVYDAEEGGHLGMSTGTFCFVSRLYPDTEPSSGPR